MKTWIRFEGKDKIKFEQDDDGKCYRSYYDDTLLCWGPRHPVTTPPAETADIETLANFEDDAAPCAPL